MLNKNIRDEIDTNFATLYSLMQVQENAKLLIKKKSTKSELNKANHYKKYVLKKINQKCGDIFKTASESGVDTEQVAKYIMKKLSRTKLSQEGHPYIAFMNKYPDIVRVMLNNDTTFNKYKNSSKKFISLIEDKPALAQILLEQHTGFKKFSKNEKVLEAIIEKGDQRVFMAFKNIIGQKKIKQMSQKLGLNLKAELEQMNQEAENVDKFIKLLKENPQAAIDELKKDKDTQSYNLKDLDFGSKIRIMDAILKTQDLENFNNKQDKYFDLFSEFYTRTLMNEFNMTRVLDTYQAYDQESFGRVAKLSKIILSFTLNTLKEDPNKISNFTSINLEQEQIDSLHNIVTNYHSVIADPELKDTKKEKHTKFRHFLHNIVNAKSPEDIDNVVIVQNDIFLNNSSFSISKPSELHRKESTRLSEIAQNLRKSLVPNEHAKLSKSNLPPKKKSNKQQSRG